MCIYISIYIYIIIPRKRHNNIICSLVIKTDAAYVWNFNLPISGNNLFQSVAGTVAIATQVKSQCPIWRHERFADNISVLLNNFVRRRSRKHIEIQNTTDCTKREGRKGLNVYL